MNTPLTPPIKGLNDLGPESRAIATPWSRIVRGIGLGQHPVGFDPAEASRIRDAITLLQYRVGERDPYTRFTASLIDLILSSTEPRSRTDHLQYESHVGKVTEAIRGIQNPYSRVMAGTILLDAVAKLNIDRAHVWGRTRDVPREILADLDTIRPDAIHDENRGKHGDYERVAAWTAVFLAFRNLGLVERLAEDGRDRVHEALASLKRIPTPFFRGRGGSMLLTAVSFLGHGSLLREPEDHIGSTLSYLDSVDKLKIYPAFPSPMTPAFVKIYPLLTMLNAIGVTQNTEYLHFQGDRLHEAATLMSALEPVERTHMGLYYVMALHNLGCLTTVLPDIDQFVEPLVELWKDIDPGRDYFLYGISYAYLAQLAYFTSRSDLIREDMVDRMIGAFPRLEDTAEGRANRPYPFSYVLNVLSELGVSDRLFSPHPRYGNRAPYTWVVEHLSPGGHAESARLYMLNHALLSWALRTRPR